MIDLILNEHGGLTIAHDESDLTDITDVEVNTSSGILSLVGESIRRPLSALKPAMMEMLEDGMKGQIVRFSGWTISSRHSVSVHLVG
ncbi:hypothetical protein [Thalassospira xiamenensis]|uniref:Uncharacterized protein n=1 Tax=Thalassospira xiamenensis TaxID=220697 RepID=A0A285TSB2_9PROT|nr:hypothetical protein [Thalassospira xiamenensis]SOC26731.1 hypothetical protein SAMN05428964_105191 [Thalassospira xiamenensis]